MTRSLTRVNRYSTFVLFLFCLTFISIQHPDVAHAAPPVVSISSPVAGLTNQNAPLLTYSVSDGTVVVKIDGIPAAQRSGDTLGPLSDGPHTMRVESTDAAGDTGYAEIVFTVDTTPPTIVASRVIAGSDHNFVLTQQDLLWGWGANFAGQLGDGTTDDYHVPAALTGSAAWTTIDGGSGHTAALRSDGTIWTWGYNGWGQLGDGTTGSRSIPAQVGASNTWVIVSSGLSHVVALDADGSLWSWGSNYFGMLGDGTTTGKSVPARIGTDNDWIHVAAGGNHTIAVKKDGSLWAWGRNNYGQLGDGTMADRSSPVKIGTDLFTAIVPNGNRTFALNADGTLWAWGANGLGALGDGTTTDRRSPVQIGTNAEWAVIATGDSHSIALKKDGTLWTWGYNYYGQLGDDTSYYRPEPAQIGTETTWVAVAAGSYHNIAMKADGTLWAWGYNFSGELGDGTSANASRPVQVQMAAVMGSQDGFVINSGRRFTNNVNVELHLTSTDASGIAEMQFSNDGITWSGFEPYVVSKSWTIEPGDGKKTVYARVKDHAENWSAAQSAVIWLDTIAPTVAITSPAAGFVNTATPLLSYTAGEGIVVVKVDGVVVNKISGNSLGTLTLGAHTLRVESTDAAGNMGNDEVVFTVDLPPSIGVFSPSTGARNVNSVQLAYAVSNGTVVVSVDGAVVNKVSGDTLGPLSDGNHTVRVASTYSGGTVYVEVTFTIDTMIPVVNISAPLSGAVTDQQPLLVYSASEGTVTVRVDGVIVNKVSGSLLGPLTGGPHTVRVEARDAAYNIGFAEVSFTVIAPPTVLITSPATGSTNNTTLLLTYTVSNGTVVVKVDGMVVNKVSGNSLDPLADGSHTVRVEATDAGRTGFAERTFTVDTIAPTVSITSPTAGTTADNQPLLTYTVSDGAVTVKVDGVLVSKVSGNRLSTLSNGTHTVRVDARDATGNTSFGEVTFTVASGFTDDMESGSVKWESATGLWHVVSDTSPYPNSHSTSRSWWYGQDTTGNYDTGGANNGAIVTTTFTIPSNGQLTFWSWEQTESNRPSYDTRKVYVTTNNGSTWIQVFQSRDNTRAWHQVTVNLAAYAGMRAKLKFEFNTVTPVANGFRGWYVDDIAIQTP